MKVVAPFIKKCQGEMPATDECSLAKGFDPAKECNTHVEESQKCKSCKAKLLPCVMQAMKKAGIKPPKDDGDDHDGAKAIWLMVVQQRDEPAKKPEEDATMKVVAPFIKKCQGEMAPTDECSPAKGFDPAKECNTHVEESQKCKSCKAKLLPCVTKALTKAGIKPPKDEGDDHDGAHTHEPAKKPENDEGDDHDGAHTWDPLWHEHDEGDDHDGANAPVPPVVALQD